MKEYYVYIMTNKSNRVLYTGITSDLQRRVFEHRNHLVESFTSKYNATKPVYYEVIKDVNSALLREKQIKAGSRKKKIEMIENMNIAWEDLYKSIV